MWNGWLNRIDGGQFFWLAPNLNGLIVFHTLACILSTQCRVLACSLYQTKLLALFRCQLDGNGCKMHAFVSKSEMALLANGSCNFVQCGKHDFAYICNIVLRPDRHGNAVYSQYRSKTNIFWLRFNLYSDRPWRHAVSIFSLCLCVIM